MPVTRQALVECLDALGDDPAAELRERGIKGVVCDCHRCVLAVYIAGILRVPAEDVWVDPCEVVVAGSLQHPYLTMDLSDPLALLVDDFDNLEYPDLVLTT